VKRYPFVALLILSAVTLTGCKLLSGGDSNSDSNSSSNSSSQVPAVTLTVPGPNFAGGNQITITVAVANDQPTESLSASGTLSGAACTPATCGTFGNPTGTAGSGSYTMTYVPPSSLAATTTITLTVSSNLSPSFAATVNFPVYPAHQTVVTLSTVPDEIPASSAARALTATVYNDTGNKGVQTSLVGGGYVCPPLSGGGTVCGKLTLGTLTTGTTTTATTGVPFTQTPVTYTPPASGPASAPYDRPIIVAASVANTSVLVVDNFLIGPTLPGGIFIPESAKLNVVLASPSATPFTFQGTVSGDIGNSKTVNFTLTAGGANCSPLCGTLGAITYTRNGQNYSAVTTYTPPATVPTGADTKPTITATEVDSSVSDSFTFTIAASSCTSSTGNNGVLKGQYAFLLRGGAESNGYGTIAASFNADGNGNITGGFIDNNGTRGYNGGVPVVSAGSSYTVGSDNRGCLTLTNSNGGVGTYRIALGTINGSGVATQGEVLRFDDDTGSGVRGEGILMQQESPASVSASQFNGNYAVGFTGVDYQGGRIAAAGLMNPNGSGTISTISLDTDDNGVPASLSGSATYSLATGAANGRGTGTITLTGGGSLDFALYAVSPSEFLFITTDYPGSKVPVLSGEIKQQSGAFTATTLDNAGYVVYASGIDTTNGANVTEIGQVTIPSGGNGAGTITLDANDNGTEQAEISTSIAMSILSNGKVTMTVGGSATGQPILYLVDSTSAFWVGADKADTAGCVKKQVGGPFGNSSLNGAFFFGGTTPQVGGSYDSGAATFDGSGNITGTDDEVSPPAGGGLQSFPTTPATGGTYAFNTASPQGIGFVGSNAGKPTSIAYVVSSAEVIFMRTGANGVELFDARQ